MAFPFLTAFMVFIIVLAVLRARATKSEKNRTEAFWNRENEANNTRKADLSLLTYFTFDPGTLPLPGEDAELREAYESIRTDSGRRMLNLNGQTNTDLKLKYGPQNLEDLTVYGDNYGTLEEDLYTYGKLLREKGRLSDAIRVLEKGVALPSEMTVMYLTLASCYEEEGSPRRSESLKTLAEKNLTGYSKETVLRKLAKDHGTPQPS